MPGATNGDEPIKHAGKRRVRISGRFFPQGAGAIVNSSNQGKAGYTVARVSQGLFRITTTTRFLKIYPVGNPALQLSAAAARFVQWGDIATVAGGGHTIDLRVIDAAGAVQDVAANANNSIGFELEACQDTVAG